MNPKFGGNIFFERKSKSCIKNYCFMTHQIEEVAQKILQLLWGRVDCFCRQSFNTKSLISNIFKLKKYYSNDTTAIKAIEVVRELETDFIYSIVLIVFSERLYLASTVDDCAAYSLTVLSGNIYFTRYDAHTIYSVALLAK
ncbi:hypothetical protein SK128_025969 [Halocaridina rubra]|uniref:Uncharacterized protein n=1 Tax=Halocaridina rubra TaxID=373956 RepID=A0AAN9AAD5_HALRR